ncbi:hypothetical protein D3C74_218060 [compost metagenome]
MAIEQIKCHFTCLKRVSGQLLADRIGETFGIERAAHDEIKHGFGERIVHHGVELVPLQPAGGFVPNFAQDVGVWVSSFYRFAEIAPESMIHFVSYVQPPAVDSDFLNPKLGDFQQVFFDFRVFGIQFWHQRFERKRIIGWYAVLHLQRVFAHVKPVFVAGFFALFHHVHEGSKRLTGVVEHRVEQHLDAAFMTSLHQLLDRGDVPEMRIDLHIIGCVVLVVGCRFKDRGEIDSCNAQFT